MLFNSVDFLCFLPVVVLVYFLLPTKIRYIWLLIASYYFYMCWNVEYASFMLLSTATTYGFALVLGKMRKGKKRNARIAVILLCILINLGILFVFKYANFALDIATRIAALLDIQLEAPRLDVLLPVGISFYTFQALGYIIDVYRGDVRPEKNFLKYALFVSFFPQLVAGPIERASSFLPQIQKPTLFNLQNMRSGMLTMLWGLFLKVVLADNLAAIVDPIFDTWETQNSMAILLAVLLFAFQIYCDFHGYSQIAIGSAKILGYSLRQNFDAPYQSMSIREFWRRWHMSLNTWFTDYVYIPLGGSRKGTLRKYLNIIIVFFLSGLWHGAALHFAVWGLLNSFYMIAGESTASIRKKIRTFLKLEINGQRTNISIAWAKCFTFVLTNIAWLFFRGPSFSASLQMLKDIAMHFDPMYFVSGSFMSLFPDKLLYLSLLFCLGLLVISDSLEVRGIDWKPILLEQNTLLRWIVYVSFVVSIIVLGAYGDEYAQTQFIYFQF